MGAAWADKLPRILWTLFGLPYGFEAKVPVEVLHPTQRIEQYEEERNDHNMQIEKNILEERRDAAKRSMIEYSLEVG